MSKPPQPEHRFAWSCVWRYFVYGLLGVLFLAMLVAGSGEGFGESSYLGWRAIALSMLSGVAIAVAVVIGLLVANPAVIIGGVGLGLVLGWFALGRIERDLRNAT